METFFDFFIKQHGGKLLLTGNLKQADAWPEIHFTFARGTADRNAGSREDVPHASIERFDRECRDGLQKITEYFYSGHP